MSERRNVDVGPPEGPNRRQRPDRRALHRMPEDLIQTAGRVDLDKAVRIAKLKARTTIALFGVVVGIAIVLALVISVSVIQERNSSAEKNGDLIADLTDQLDAAEADETEQGRCELTWAAVTRVRSQAYFAAFGDLLVEVATPGADQMERVTDAISTMRDTSIAYHQAVDDINAWAALPTEMQLPCPVTDEDLR